MISYELAKQLENAGFPMKHAWWGIENDGSKFLIGPPSLSELIEACGDKFGMLEKIYDKNQWHCRPCTGKCMYFSTPEEAVARLWLELNKK